jgi:hypothetical protein
VRHAGVCHHCCRCSDVLQHALCFGRRNNPIGTGDDDHAKCRSDYAGTFNARYFNRHQLHDDVQLAGVELPNDVLDTATADANDLGTVGVDNPEPDGEPNLHR